MPTSSHITTNTGLRITPEKIELAVTSKSAIKQFETIVLDAQTIQKGELIKPDILKKSLVELLKKFQLNDRFITLGLPEHTNFLKSLNVTDLPDSEIQQKIIWESENQLPLPSKELYIDWAWLPNSKNTVQISAMPQKSIDNYISILNQPEINLTPLAVEPTSLTLLRLTPSQNHAQLVIDADTTSTLIIVDPNHAVNLSAINHSTNTQQLNSDFNNIIIEMINYYQKKYQHQVKQIFFTGPFSQQLPQFLPKNIPNQPIKLPAALKPHQSVSYSLAQTPVAPPQDSQTINLIPPTVQANYNQAATHHLKRISIIISTIFLTIINLFSLWYLFQIITHPNESKLKDQTTAPEVTELTNNINNINQQSTAVLQINNQEEEFNQAFQEIFKILPPNFIIRYLQFNASNKQITIRGLAPTQEQILEFKQQLETLPNITNVILPLSVLENQTNVEFSFTFNWQSNK